MCCDEKLVPQGRISRRHPPVRVLQVRKMGRVSATVCQMPSLPSHQILQQGLPEGGMGVPSTLVPQLAITRHSCTSLSEIPKSLLASYFIASVCTSSSSLSSLSLHLQHPSSAVHLCMVLLIDCVPLLSFLGFFFPLHLCVHIGITGTLCGHPSFLPSIGHCKCQGGVGSSGLFGDTWGCFIVTFSRSQCLLLHSSIPSAYGGIIARWKPLSPPF